MAIEVSHELVDPKVLVNSSRQGLLLFEQYICLFLGECIGLNGKDKRGQIKPKGKQVNIPIPEQNTQQTGGNILFEPRDVIQLPGKGFRPFFTKPNSHVIYLIRDMGNQPFILAAQFLFSTGAIWY